MKLFVYGTLLTGFGNWQWALAPQNGEPLTLLGYELHDAGGYPMMIPSLDNESKVHGEVFEINIDELRQIDRLEGHPNFYERVEIKNPLTGENMFTYICQQGKYLPLIESGSWREHVKA